MRSIVYTEYRLPNPEPEPPQIHAGWFDPETWVRVQHMIEEDDRANAAYKAKLAVKKQEAEVS